MAVLKWMASIAAKCSIKGSIVLTAELQPKESIIIYLIQILACKNVESLPCDIFFHWPHFDNQEYPTIVPEKEEQVIEFWKQHK